VGEHRQSLIEERGSMSNNGWLSRTMKSDEFKRSAEHYAQPPKDHVAEHQRQIQEEIESRDRIPRESLRRLDDMVSQGRTTNTILSRGVGKLAWFVEKQPPAWLQWISTVCAVAGLVVAVIAASKSCSR
jgi:hypothetical protein